MKWLDSVVALRKVARAGAAALSIAVVTGCGGGGGGGGGGSSTPPPTVNLSADPVEILAGGSTKLSWSTTNATTCSASDGWSGARDLSGTSDVTELQASSTFTLSCSNGEVEATKSITVAVSAAGAAAKTRTLDFSVDFGGMVASPSRGVVYATYPLWGQVVVIASGDYVEVDRFYVGPQASAVALSADESTLYVALRNGGGVAVVDLDTKTVRRIDVAQALNSNWITALIEVRPGVLLVGGSSGHDPIRLITLDVHTGAIQTVASNEPISAATAFVLSPDRSFLYVADGPTLGETYLLKLDARQEDLPLLAKAPSGTPNNQTLVVSRDGTRLMNGGQILYDTQDLSRVTAGNIDGVVGETADARTIARLGGADRIQVIDGATLTEHLYHLDCPPRLLTGVIPGARSDEWLLNLSGQVCVVSLTHPDVPPGIDADRTLQPDVEPIELNYAEIAVPGGVDITLDDARRLVYVAVPVQQRIDVVSLASFSIVDSIAVPGQIGTMVMSADGQRLYGAIFDQGHVVAIDLNSRQVAADVDISQLLGRVETGAIVEVRPNELIVGANSDFADPSYLVQVPLNNPAAARRIGCANPYGGVTLWTSPDRHYLYVATNSDRCPLIEKRDMTDPDFRLVLGSQSNSQANLGRHAMSSDGALIFGQEGEVLSSSTLWTTGLLPTGGEPVAPSDPDKVYYVSFNSIDTVRVHDFHRTASGMFGCLSVQWPHGVVRSLLTADEKLFVLLGLNEGQGLCFVEVPQ